MANRLGPHRVGTLALAAAVALAGLSGCTHEKGSQAALCREVKHAPRLQTVLAGFRQADPDELKRRLASARSAYADLADAAPGDIRADMGRIDGLVDAVITSVTAHPNDGPALAADIHAYVTKHPEVSASTKAVAAYSDSHCHVQLD
jgi:hypothetical protein